MCEALPSVTGYKVHADKIRRLGVPVFEGTTIVSANGRDHVESVTVARADESLRPVEGTWRTFACDTLLVAVGLEPVNEFATAGRILRFQSPCGGGRRPHRRGQRRDVRGEKSRV